ncbi:hypothetical protein [Klebsiella spallanzanii]|jgi:hypothetical protein|uniref:Uncharacterized protein n=1 Tax=Klebsiella spallanzanii TaxID=2587528 RepID=A0A564L5N4_9ENTR|nr:hypothetical protein [Klebsiella spallanzanii]VUS76803.1 hypothetical protein SB6408_05303 [Klebsiella spallanzanii]
MKNIDELTYSPLDEQEIKLEGYIVYLDDGGLYVIGLDYGEDYTKASSLAVKNKNLADNLEANVSLYGGGSSRLFHHVKLSGLLEKDRMTDKQSILVRELSIEDNGQWISIDVDKHYEPRSGKGSNWHDLFNN